MSIVNTIERIRVWAETEICSKVELKLPDDKQAAEGYPYKLVTPAAFAMFTPTSDKLPPNIRAPVPSVCVRLVELTDTAGPTGGGRSRQYKIVLAFSTWDPGPHGMDTFVQAEPGTFVHLDKDTAKAFQKADMGWRDAWNFVDVAMRALETTPDIGGLHIVEGDGIKCGPAVAQDGVFDFYPYWYAWIEFFAEEPVLRKAPTTSADPMDNFL